jgi:beta-fructofuranosidase
MTWYATPYKLSALMPPTPLTQNCSLGNGALLVDFSHVSSIVVNVEMNFTSLNSSTLSSTASTIFTFLSLMSNESLTGGQFLAGGSNFSLKRSLLRGFDNSYFVDKFCSSPAFTDTRTMSAVLD